MNTNTSTTAKAILKLVLVISIFFFSNTSVFAQEKQTVVNETEVSTPKNNDVIVLDSQNDFMNWFMSSKQTQFVDDNNEVSGNSATARKKQFMNAGVTPNKVLYRTFVKKVAGQDKAIV
jgi:hypothetical protein